MSARVHTNPSNRAKPRDTLEKKVVFKSVLDSPLRVSWPSVPINVQNTALACTLSLLDGISEYQSARGQQNKKRKRLEKDTTQKKRKIETATEGYRCRPTGPPSHASPQALSHLIIGLNAVTKRLDDQIRSLRKAVSLNADSTSAPTPPPAPIKVIVVCRADVDPQILIDHLPHEVAAFNSASPNDLITLIPLPKGAEAALARAVGLRRVTAIAMDCEMPGLATFTSILDSIPTITAPWLTSLAASATPVLQQLIPTHVKQLRTTAPKDMKMAKLLRAEGKAAAKAKKKSKAVPMSKTTV
ncbi:Ribonucleases p mrp protein subunit pop3 kDa subunit [Mycena sanguinolenta]|uniref:Ribonucleases p mrp protein subunit pop3 kDa subunit n=1 Tax=Mycena sanguinolenta TaxID=230812 RepID=A0A8H6XDG8_9AGAR|nr:Ribonucleases p mrp protein subunit pop3 kDa subunit [Mycena sanguinolenta]